MPPPSLQRRHILKIVVLTVFGTLLAWYLSAILSFAGNSYGFNNRFSEVAIQHHWWFLVWSNLVVLKGYLLVAAGYVLLIYPLVRLWGKVRAFARWGVVWRTLLFACLLYGFFIFKLMLEKPYFGDYSYLLGWYDALGRVCGTGVQDAVHAMITQVFPLTAIVCAAGFYLFELRRWFTRAARPLLFSFSAVAGILALFVVSGYGVNRVPDMEELAGGKKRPKNIVILGSDSLRADHLSCNGYHRLTSPNIDRIAAKGVNFERCLTPIASTLESLTSMFSSQYPHTHGVRHMFPSRAMVDRANQEAPSLGAELKRQGYDTAVIGDWCACGFNELPMGFEKIIVSDFDNFRVYMSEVVFLHHQILPLFFDNHVGHMLFPKLKSFANYMTPEVVTDQVIDRIKQRAGDRQPFLLFGYYSCTHLPYKTPTHYAKMWTDPKYDGPHKHELALNVDEFIGGTDINEKWSKLPRKEVEQITALYDGCVRMFDDSVGRVVAELEKQGLLDDTIILVTGDHGDDLFEPNCTFGHGTTFNGGDQANHVPAIFYVPGLEKPQRHAQLSRTLDFAPTLLDLVGVPAQPRFEGASLAPLIRGEKKSLGLAYFGETSYLFFRRTIPGEDPLFIPPMDETTFIDPDFDFHFVLKDKFQDAVLKTKEHCVRTERFKYIRTPGVNRSIERLFDLREDPHCERDMKTRYPEVKARLSAAMDEWLTTHKQSTTAEIYGILGEDTLQPTAP
ncbi:sulfatase-like hydrolase/transferase [Prosthecobacter sp.]|jgi:arylsulfatase A-like enzyme|uniref:sulfatase-like hydrolase/transferase n=1 Tax=Prosthecobacter sp. TaxID=1965333 RepID=UPI0037C95106